MAEEEEEEERKEEEEEEEAVEAVDNARCIPWTSRLWRRRRK